MGDYNPAIELFSTLDIDAEYDEQIRHPEGWAGLADQSSEFADISQQFSPECKPVGFYFVFFCCALTKFLGLQLFEFDPSMTNHSVTREAASSSTQPIGYSSIYHTSSTTINSEMSAASSIGGEQPPFHSDTPTSFVPPQANPMAQSAQGSSTGGEPPPLHPNTPISFAPPLANLTTQPPPQVPQPPQVLPPPPPAAITPAIFQMNYPIWSSLMPIIFDTAITVAFQDVHLGWLPDLQPGVPSPLTWVVRMVCEAIIISYMEDYPLSAPAEGELA